jgi:hypothetical protein
MSSQYALAGVMMRATLNENSKNVGHFKLSGGGTVRQVRFNTGGNTTAVNDDGNTPIWLRIVRIGNKFKYFTSQNGTTWILKQTLTISGYPNTLFVGLAVASYDDNQKNISIFSDVQVGTGVAPLIVQTQGLTFTAHKKETYVELDWLNDSGEINDYFVTERSANGITNWQPILKTEGEGQVDEMLFFTELDKNPLQGDNFYRLRWVLKDGTFSYSDVQRVEMPAPKDYTLFPNPASEEVWLKLPNRDFSQIRIFNSLGILVREMKIPMDRNELIRISLEGMPDGLYDVQLSGTEIRTMTLKLVVIK